MLFKGGLEDSERLRSHAVQFGQFRPGDVRESVQGGVAGAVQRSRGGRTNLAIRTWWLRCEVGSVSRPLY